MIVDMLTIDSSMFVSTMTEHSYSLYLDNLIISFRPDNPRYPHHLVLSLCSYDYDGIDIELIKYANFHYVYEVDVFDNITFEHVNNICKSIICTLDIIRRGISV